MSTTHSSTSSVSSSGPVPSTKAIKPPRNSHRLTGQTESTSPPPTLGPAITFKVPSLPRQRESSASSTNSSTSGRRPLKMVEENSIPLSPSEADTPTSTTTSTPNRLKRLSLIARPSPLAESPRLAELYTKELDRPISAGAYAEDQDRPMSVRMGGEASRTPRSMRMRSSISYSPASASASAPNRPVARSVLMSPVRADGRDGEGAGRTSLDVDVKGETWSDRHADLLQSIAQKQRRINELKQELQAEQSALYSLKTHFASLVSATFSSPPPSMGQTSTLPIHRSTSNTTDPDWQLISPATSSQTSPNPDPKRDEWEPNPPGFSALLDEVLGNAPLVDPSVVEGGRRFIGNLMRTVGAAAGGTVPPEEAGDDQRGKDDGTPKEGNTIGGMDLSVTISLLLLERQS